MAPRVGAAPFWTYKIMPTILIKVKPLSGKTKRNKTAQQVGRKAFPPLRTEGSIHFRVHFHQGAVGALLLFLGTDVVS